MDKVVSYEVINLVNGKKLTNRIRMSMRLKVQKTMENLTYTTQEVYKIYTPGNKYVKYILRYNFQLRSRNQRKM